MSGLRNRARCRNWRASHRLLEYPSETRRFQNEDQQSIRRDEQGSEATWPMTKPSEFAERERSEEHTSELQSLMSNSYAVFCLKKKNEERRHESHKTHTTQSL